MRTQRFLYVLLLAMDANVRLKWTMMSSNKVDPGLGTGWLLFVPEPPYQAYLAKYGYQAEVRPHQTASFCQLFTH